MLISSRGRYALLVMIDLAGHRGGLVPGRQIAERLEQNNVIVNYQATPDEEGFTGAKAMLAAGVLREPAPQAGFALHVHSGTPSGLVLCGEGTFMAGCTLFRVTVHGTGCHGAMPETGVDPIHIAANIYLALEELVAREVAAKQPAVITVGRFIGKCRSFKNTF